MPQAKPANKRTPLREQPLRTPGESLGEERDRVLYEGLLPFVMLAAFTVVFALLEWWAYFTKAPRQPVLATIVALGAVAYGAYRFRKARPVLHALSLGLQGEKAVGQFLESHRGVDWHVLHDVRGPGFNVDHILVSPKGVFTVETKTRSKPAKGPARVVYDGDKVLVDGFAPDRDPIAQARAARDWVRDLLLDTTAIHYPVRGVVLFPGWFVESPGKGKRPDVWVLNEKAFVKYVESEPDVISGADVALASARLVNYITR